MEGEKGVEEEGDIDLEKQFLFRAVSPSLSTPSLRHPVSEGGGRYAGAEQITESGWGWGWVWVWVGE